MRSWWKQARRKYTNEVDPTLEGQEAVVFGWVQEIRDLGGIKFLVIRDSKGTIQVTAPRAGTEPSLLRKIDRLQRESVVGVRGAVKREERAPRGIEIVPKSIAIFNEAKTPLPVDLTGRTPTNLDVRLDFRILDLRRAECQAIFRIRWVALSAIRSFLTARGFMEVQTPKIISAATEGGAALFPLSYYEREAFLAQSPQLYKEQLVSAFEKVFEIGPIFRAEKFHTTRHLSEVTSVDVEEAFATAEESMGLLEELVAHTIGRVRASCSSELKALNHPLELPTLPFERYTYDEVLASLGRRGISVVWGEDLPTPALKALSKLRKGFFFIVDWPSRSKPFYMLPHPRKPELCHSFDLMYGWLEVASGGQRIHKEALLKKRLREQGLDPKAFEFHLKAFRYGMPPHSGWGLGLERFLLILTGKKNVREVTLFPRDRQRLTP